VPHTHGPLDGSVYAKVKKKSSSATVTRNGAAPGGGACSSGQHTRSMSTDSGNSTASTKTDRTERAPPSPYRGGAAAGGGVRPTGSMHTVPAQVHTSRSDGVDKAMVERETDILDDNTLGGRLSRVNGHDKGSYMPNGIFTAKVSPAWSLPERAGIMGQSIQRSTSAPVHEVHRCPPPLSQPEIEESIAQLNQLMLDLDPSFVPITAEVEVPTHRTLSAPTGEDFRSQGAASAGGQEGRRGFSRDPTAVSTSLRYRSASVDRCEDDRSDSYGRNAVDPHSSSHLPYTPRHSHQSPQIQMPQTQEADMSVWTNISAGHVVEHVERSPDGGFHSLIGTTSPNTPAFPLSSLTPYSSPSELYPSDAVFRLNIAT
uniref:uncharacterized protein n=1 Tax=Myxine glutinosa TaxID=7769 RepID=UPI00358DFCDA